MKLFKYGLPFAALALLASCANDKLDGPNPEPAPGPGEYAYLNIALGVASDTRAPEVADQNGAATEYAVRSGKLLLFSTDTDPKLVASVPLTLGTGDANDDTDISRTHEFELKMEGVEKGAYKALIVLNEGNITLPQMGESYSAWSRKPQTSTNGKGAIDAQNYITMINALGWVGVPAADTDPSVFVDITANDFYYKQADNGTQKPAKEFYVNRLVAKVTLGTERNGITIGDNYNVQGDENTGDVLNISSWEVFQKNSEFYPVQLIDDGTNNWNDKLNITNWVNTILTGDMARFTTSGATFTRVNWAVDPNYSGTASGKLTSQSSGDYTNTSHDAVEYANENTFDILNMKKNQTTQLAFKGTYTIAGQSAPKSFVEFNGKKYAVTNANDVPAGTGYTLQQIISDDSELTAAATKLDVKTDLPQITFYKDGVVYYSVLVRHFDNPELGYDEGEVTGTKGAFRLPYEDGYVASADARDQNADKNYLGRYGMVRNNWYEIHLTSATGPGSPTPPTPGNTPDDDPDPYYLNCKINILTWAKRTQNAPLK